MQVQGAGAAPSPCAGVGNCMNAEQVQRFRGGAEMHRCQYGGAEAE